jgi:hypothetical protein
LDSDERDGQDVDSLSSERRIDATCDEFQGALRKRLTLRTESFAVCATPIERQQLLKEQGECIMLARCLSMIGFSLMMASGPAGQPVFAQQVTDVRIRLDPPGQRDFVLDNAGMINAADEAAIKKLPIRCSPTRPHPSSW